ncbi:hypothetical protein O181_036721 [Austropuccinia psidii MF-1]|uniref:Reverse transcriptase/retrotransposon-derived protein RNase H-like domain-containing protein n=1 Tax=Austropuccinia psidii MF-1 TaxID=1389203 RepID=A0A9Q3HA55_9BASI|nr:hypothetical protein [Austropuccinia psidii MF-1]
MTPIGTINKEIVTPHRKGNIRLTPELVVLEDSHNQVFLVGTEYQRLHGINIYNSKNRNITIGTRKEKKSSLDIYQFANKDPLEELIHELKKGKFNTNLTSKNKLSKLTTLEKNGPAFSMGREPLGEITNDRRYAYERIKNALTNAPVLVFQCGFELPFKIYIDEAFNQLLGAALHQRQIVDGEPRERVICYVSRKLEDSEGLYGETQAELLCLVLGQKKLHYYVEGAVFEFYTD